MQPLAALGGVCTLLSLVGYAAGIAEPYPGRELTIVGLMLGISLFLVERGSQ